MRDTVRKVVDKVKEAFDGGKSSDGEKRTAPTPPPPHSGGNQRSKSNTKESDIKDHLAPKKTEEDTRKEKEKKEKNDMESEKIAKEDEADKLKAATRLDKG